MKLVNKQRAGSCEVTKINVLKQLPYQNMPKLHNRCQKQRFFFFCIFLAARFFGAPTLIEV